MSTFLTTALFMINLIFKIPGGTFQKTKIKPSTFSRPLFFRGMVSLFTIFVTISITTFYFRRASLLTSFYPFRQPNFLTAYKVKIKVTHAFYFPPSSLLLLLVGHTLSKITLKKKFKSAKNLKVINPLQKPRYNTPNFKKIKINPLNKITPTPFTP